MQFHTVIMRALLQFFVKFYPNEIIIENPGSFPSGVDRTNIITHPSSPRNKKIAETLQKLRYVQRSGQGVDIIFKDMLSLGKSAPEYNLYSDAVSLNLRSSLEDIEFLKFITKEEETNGEFSVSESCILKYIKSNKTITLGKAAEVAQITTQSAANVLNKLCQKRNVLQGKPEINICLLIECMKVLMPILITQKIKTLMKFKPT